MFVGMKCLTATGEQDLFSLAIALLDDRAVFTA